MRILEVTNEKILFDNGKAITFYHDQNCCEHNYADFEQLEDMALEYDFESELKFEFVDKSGFRFGDEYRMFFVPCYSEQNGWYSSDIEILYDGAVVLKGWCEEHFY